MIYALYGIFDLMLALYILLYVLHLYPLVRFLDWAWDTVEEFIFNQIDKFIIIPRVC